MSFEKFEILAVFSVRCLYGCALMVSVSPGPGPKMSPGKIDKYQVSCVVGL